MDFLLVSNLIINHRTVRALIWFWLFCLLFYVQNWSVTWIATQEELLYVISSSMYTISNIEIQNSIAAIEAKYAVCLAKNRSVHRYKCYDPEISSHRIHTGSLSVSSTPSPRVELFRHALHMLHIAKKTVELHRIHLIAHRQWTSLRRYEAFFFLFLYFSMSNVCLFPAIGSRDE